MKQHSFAGLSTTRRSPLSMRRMWPGAPFCSISLTAQYPFELAEHITAWWRARGRYRSGCVIIRTVGDPMGIE
jgi:hypothetical protein